MNYVNIYQAIKTSNESKPHPSPTLTKKSHGARTGNKLNCIGSHVSENHIMLHCPFTQTRIYEVHKY